MNESRNEQRSSPQHAAPPIQATETLRHAAAVDAVAAPRGEERGSIFWQAVGGTVLSIVALVAITLYQQLTSSINDVRVSLATFNNDLRKDLGQLSQSQGDCIKKDEFNNRLTSVWNSLKDIQTLQTGVTALKERCLVTEQKDKADADKHEQLAKDVQELEAVVAVLKERTMAHEHQQKAEESRKELMRELQQLRERLATLEGRDASKPVVRPAVRSQPTE